MSITSGIFSAEANFEKRLIDSLDSVAEIVSHLKGIGLRIVLMSGSFDLIHLGHVKYLAPAKALDDVLVVGVDCDEKIRQRKLEGRPLVPERERLEMLAYQRPVDLLFLKMLTIRSGRSSRPCGLTCSSFLRTTAIPRTSSSSLRNTR